MSLAVRIGWAVAALILAYMRLHGARDANYQAIAHVIVGGWFGAWLMGSAIQRDYKIVHPQLSLDMHVGAGYYAVLGIALTMVEVYAFAMRIAGL